ncbi:DUF938 domain-containing protein [Aliikangiella coralliicola]|uniref:DUF938 domain-containing protein n=1 Tax=Aliikangiella coralliicola TaxID=2592383 RepID=A0A545UIA8_9GAMM|nr:DUF938 domain-containing protein [Aliikangiella coralliicola]TQV89204.1 DUF938 domain-containing protein [Aliikangiella coralliicola]
MSGKPFAESCERNQQPILAKIKSLLVPKDKVLEIGSGTGQHAVFFAQNLPEITWYTSDLPENHAGIQAWISDANLDNVVQPFPLDLLNDSLPEEKFNCIFSANTAHIMPWAAVEKMYQCAGEVLLSGGLLILYGPFNYQGEYTSESNRRFDQWLKSRFSHQGIRNFEALQDLARNNSLSLRHDYEMPANNRILVWQRE